MTFSVNQNALSIFVQLRADGKFITFFWDCTFFINFQNFNWTLLNLSFLIYRLQVCAKYMPIASIKIGVDLDPIPAIKGCLTF